MKRKKILFVECKISCVSVKKRKTIKESFTESFPALEGISVGKVKDIHIQNYLKRSKKHSDDVEYVIESVKVLNELGYSVGSN